MNFFVHIPKTAGTSFRVAAERQFSKKRVVFDYGEHSPVTSQSALDYLYVPEKPDMEGFLKYCRQQHVQLIAGHKPATRFLPSVRIGNVITFVREPLQRAFSGYLHFRRDGRFTGTFREYFSDPSQTNTLERMLGKVSLRAMGFVGLTEHYDESLRMINQRYGWRIRKKRVNRSRFFDPGPEKISAEDRAAFRELNAADYALYREADWWFGIRRELAQRGEPFAHAQVDSVEDGKIRGWAWWAEPAEEPPRIEICVNDAPASTAAADRELKRWTKAGAPGQGRVGFAAGIDAHPGDRITCRIAQTGQPLIPEPAIAA